MSLDSLIAEVIGGVDQRIPFGAGKEPGEQGGIEWLMERVGHATASRFRDILDFTKAGKPGAKRTAYLWELVIERLTARPVDHFPSVAMQYGTDNESAARMAYEAVTGAMVLETGFHKALGFIGASPDGLVDDDGAIEIKCPWNSTNHLQCFLTGIPEEHIAQVQGVLWVTEREYCDFISFDGRMPLHLQLYVQRIERDGEYIGNLDREVRKFLDEVDTLRIDIEKAARVLDASNGERNG